MTTYYVDENGKKRVNFGDLPEVVKWGWADFTKGMGDEEARGYLPAIGMTGAVEYTYTYRDANGDQRGWSYLAENGAQVDLSMYDDEMIDYYKEAWRM